MIKYTYSCNSLNIVFIAVTSSVLGTIFTYLGTELFSSGLLSDLALAAGKLASMTSILLCIISLLIDKSCLPTLALITLGSFILLLLNSMTVLDPTEQASISYSATSILRSCLLFLSIINYTKKCGYEATNTLLKLSCFVAFYGYLSVCVLLILMTDLTGIQIIKNALYGAKANGYLILATLLYFSKVPKGYNRTVNKYFRPLIQVLLMIALLTTQDAFVFVLLISSVLPTIKANQAGFLHKRLSLHLNHLQTISKVSIGIAIIGIIIGLISLYDTEELINKYVLFGVTGESTSLTGRVSQLLAILGNPNPLNAHNISNAKLDLSIGIFHGYSIFIVSLALSFAYIYLFLILLLQITKARRTAIDWKAIIFIIIIVLLESSITVSSRTFPSGLFFFFALHSSFLYTDLYCKSSRPSIPRNQNMLFPN